MKRLLTVSALWAILAPASAHQPGTTGHGAAGGGSFTAATRSTQHAGTPYGNGCALSINHAPTHAL